ncbi:MAG TPA: hypothetical protein VFX51_23485 [Solirubrobacteraceae bacterium]|nr:hypothetical protein [Solirubrobacteraceae bacterium]
MGSFSDVVLSFDFRADTPDEVLAAFSALQQPLPDEDAYWGPAPDLPPPVSEPSDLWSPDWRESGWVDPFADEPWRHDWASWLSGSMSVATVPSAALVWTQAKVWNFTCRSSFKTDAEGVFEFLEWLGPFIDVYNAEASYLIGYIHYEYDERPHLVWFKDRRLTLENLNTDQR